MAWSATCWCPRSSSLPSLSPLSPFPWSCSVDDPLPLVRDVLDNQVYDVNRQKVGKVDGIILTPRQNRPPRISVIELHMQTAWRRLSERMGDSFEAMQRFMAPELVTTLHS